MVVMGTSYLYGGIVMRLALIATLALMPPAALAQNVSPFSIQNGLMAMDKSRAPLVSSASASTPSVALASAVRLHDVISTSPHFDLRDTADYHNGSISNNFYLGSDERELVSAPKLIHVVNRSLREVDAVPGKADVTVAVRVSAEGVPNDLKIIHSAGASADKDTLAAVSQYRFQPGLLNHLPAESSITVRIQLEKQ